MERNQVRPAQGGLRALAAGIALAMMVHGAAGTAVAQTAVQTPQPTVPEVFTLMGQFVRVAYNNEGFVTLGYRTAQQSVGEEWVLLEVGLTVRTKENYTLKREHFSLKTPDGTTIPLATQQEYGKAGYLRALNSRAKVSRDSINYFPQDATQGAPIIFFANIGNPGAPLATDQVELSKQRANVGRLFFHVPGGIKVGQHWLIVKFSQSEVQVPFRILTKDEEKQFSKSWEDIKKAHDAAIQ